MDIAMILFIYFSLWNIRYIHGFIAPLDDRIVCPEVQCNNNGTLDLRMCVCDCPPSYSGYLCEIEMKQTSWPEGRYALHTSMFGCPEHEEYGWEEGYVNMTLKPNSRNMFWNDKDPISFEPHILGPFSQQNIQINFCVMNNHKSGNDFQEGSITIFGYTYDIGGVLATVQDNTSLVTLWYCCRDDGNVTTPINLPKTFPFILFKGPTADSCQEVEDMETSFNAFFMTDELKIIEFSGILPNFSRTDTFDRHIGLPMCYYHPFSRRECGYKSDFGASYNGRINVTKTGKQCLLWSDVKDFTTNTRWIGEFELNYCRKVENWQSHICYYSSNEYEECNIPYCEEDSRELETLGEGLSYNSAPAIEGSDAWRAVDGLIGMGVSYSNERLYIKPWYLLDLQEFVEVHAIVLNRQRIWFPVNHRYVGTYVSKNRWDFLTYGAYRCDNNRNPRLNRIFRYQCKRPIVGQFVSVKNFDTTEPTNKQGYFHYFEIDEIQVIGKRKRCGRRLGLVSGEVYDYQLQSSSNENSDLLATHGRLFFQDGWCAATIDRAPWFMVDLVISHMVQGTELQGLKNGQNVRLIKSFKIMYGVERDNLTVYEDPDGVEKIFNVDKNLSPASVQRFIFNHEIYSRFVKVVPIEYTDPCLKMEIIGCPRQVVRDLWCRNYTYDFGFEMLRYHTFWMNELHDYDRLKLFGLTYDQCLLQCQNISCNLFTFTLKDVSCYMHFGHKYTPAWRKWWVAGVEESTISGQRLCIKDFLPMDACGEIIHLDNIKETRIFSPSFPLNYGQGTRCVWTILSDSFIEIEIVSVLLQQTTSLSSIQQMGIYDINPGSCEDTLTIIDYGGFRRIITAAKPSFRGEKIISASNKVKIVLSSCFQLTKSDDKNFELKVTKTDLPGCGTIDSCFKTCSVPAAYIMTPGFPSHYEPDSTCSWKISGVYGQYVKFNFINLDVYDEAYSCEKSYVTVYDVTLEGNLRSLGKFCKDDRQYKFLISSWHNMQIEFRASSSNIGGNGFLGKYSIESFIQESFSNLSFADCSDQWHGFRNSCYTVQKQQSGITWIEAEQQCKRHGGHLVSIADESEMKFIHYLVTVINRGLDGGKAYIGLKKKTDGYNTDDYVWVDGNPITITAWYHDDESGRAQPDGLQNEQCSLLELSSIHNLNDWHDVACAYDKIISYICEIDNTIDHKENDIRESIVLEKTDLTDNLYKCYSGEYILIAFTCDGKVDCLSGEDEHNCSRSCSEDQFTCTNGECISISLYCDFKGHCTDGSDEQECERKNCTMEEWQCDNGQCIPVNSRCDFVSDCFDKSDELECVECGAGSFQCYDQTCIPFTRVCDGFVDCSGLLHEDEPDTCLQKTQSSCADWWAKGLRENGEYLIDLSLNSTAKVECVFEDLGNTVRTTTVVHHSEEETVLASMLEFDIYPLYSASNKHINKLKDVSSCSQSIELYCHFTQNKVYRYNLEGNVTDNKTPTETCDCPFVGNCDTNINKCNCGNEDYDWYTAENNEIRSDIGVISDESQLPVTNLYTASTSFYDTFVQVKLGPLKCIQDSHLSSNLFRCNGGQTIVSSDVCLLNYDHRGELLGCRDLSHLSNCGDFVCPPGFVKCRHSYCVPPVLLCNGVPECPNGEDEVNCDNPNCTGLFRCKDSSICINPNKRCNGHAECPHFDDELLCNAICPTECNCNEFTMKCFMKGNQTISFPSKARKIDISSSDLHNSRITLKDNFFLAELNMSRSRFSNLENIEFGSSSNLYSLDLSHNALSFIPRNAFEGLYHLKELLLHGNVLLHVIAPFSFSGLSKISSIVTSHINIVHLKENSFRGLDNLMMLNLSYSSIEEVDDNAFCGLEKLKTLDITKNSISAFSKDMFAGLDNLQQIYSDAFVFCCLRPDSVMEENCLPGRDEFSSCSDMMRNDALRVCLWIIGLCALLGNFTVITYRVLYDRSSLSKVPGIFITSLGIADFLMGVYMLTIASADVLFRGNYVWNDLSWRYGIPCKIAGVLSTMSSECSVLFLFFITVDRFSAIKYPFGQVKLGKTSAKYISVSVFVISTLLAIIPLIPGSYFDGHFYSRSAVCLALPLTRDKPVGWEYSVSIFIVFNFVLFLIIAGFQLVIYREITATVTQVRSTKKRQDLTIARNLFLIVVSDFLCWFPVGVMGLMALSGHSIPGEVYAWTAVFILPINSALNPFLYTFSAIIRNRRDSIRRSTRKNMLTPNVSIVSQSYQNSKSFSDVSDRDVVATFNATIQKSGNENLLSKAEIDEIVEKLLDIKHRLHTDSMTNNQSCSSLEEKNEEADKDQETDQARF